MSSVLEDIVEKIEQSRTWRVKEISDLRAIYSSTDVETYKSRMARAIVVMCYAHWEGYYADCINIVIDEALKSDIKVAAVNRDLMIGSMWSCFESLKDKNHSIKAKRAFLADFYRLQDASFDVFERKVVAPSSNLNFEKLNESLDIIGCDIQPFMRYRNQINKEVAGWRHSVAHGNLFEINHEIIFDHSNLVETLLTIIKETFISKSEKIFSTK